MNDMIKEILDFKEDADYKRLSVGEISILRYYITKLESKIEDYELFDNQEIERLNNIINELEKYLIDCSQDLEFRCYANAFLDKLRELKGDSSNE